MQNNRTKSNILKELYNGVNKTELSSDFILPDSMPDARAILHTFCNCRKKDQQMKDGKLTYGIDVFYTVLYTDENGDIRAVKYRNDTSDTVSVKGCDSDCQAVFCSLPPDVTVRLSNPRKLSIRCQCPMQIKVFGTLNDARIPSDGEDIEVQTVQVSSMQVNCGREEGQTLSEDILIPNDMPEPTELLGVYLSPKISDLRSSDGKAVIRGEIGTLVLYRTADGNYMFYEKQLPISQMISVEGAEETSQCTGEIYLYDVTTDLSTDQNGQLRTVEVDLLYDIYVCCTSNETSEIVTDVYSLSRSCDAEYKTLDIHSAVGVFNTNISVNEKAPLNGKHPEKILFSTCIPENLKSEIGASGVICSGEISAHGIVTENGEFEPLSCTFPFKATIELDTPEGCEFVLSAYCDKPKLRCDNENVYCDTEIYLTLSTMKNNSVKTVASISIGEDEPAEEILPLTLYYPRKGDTVWNIAKKYRSTVSDIISANSLTSTDISSCRVLVIPKIRV